MRMRGLLEWRQNSAGPEAPPFEAGRAGRGIPTQAGFALGILKVIPRGQLSVGLNYIP